MAKLHYAIRTSIDRSFLDHEITIPIGGVNTKPSPVRQLLFFVAGVTLTIWAASSSWIASSGATLIFLFVVWMIIAIVYLGALTKTKELRIQTVPALLSYAPKEARRVRTRRDSNPSAFYSIVGIDQIDEDGLIHFPDGRVGQAYLVVGSASYLLFDADREAILDRVDAFWRKIDTGCEFIQITTKEAQRVYRQVVALEKCNRELQIRDPELLALQQEQYDILTGHVGRKFTSIHQYLVLIGKSADQLRRGHNVLQAEVEGSSLMIKEATVLDRDETYQMLQTFYRGDQADRLVSRSALTEPVVIS